MKNVSSFLKQILGNDRGFSIIQGLAVAAALGGVSLALMQQSKISNQQSRAASTNMAVLELQGQMHNYLLMESACTASLGGPVQAVGNTREIMAISDGTNIVFSKNETYIQKQVRIDDMKFTRDSDNEGTLAVIFNRVGNKDGRGVGGATVRKEYKLNAQFDSNNRLLKCYSDISNAVDDSVKTVIAGICNHDTATPANGLLYDAIYGACQLTEMASTPLVTPCPGDEAIVQITYDANTRQYSRICGATYKIPPTCADNSLLRRRSDGSFDCVNPTCTNGLFQGLDGNGAPICISCGQGQSVVAVNGVWKCTSISCTQPNTYFTGLNPQGDPICNSLVEASACTSGGQLSVTSGGQVKFQCCTANCSDSGNICSGAVYNASNGCGVCSGTKAPECSDASSHCQGSYPSTNGCGNCNGTKLPQNGVWGDWTATSEFRPKEGAVCSCDTRTVAQERKYVRTCAQPQCGGVACSGETEQWLDTGAAVACNPSGCTPSGKCTGWGYASNNNMFMSGSPDTGSCETYRYQYLDIQTATFKRGNIYSLTQGRTYSAEALAGDTPRSVLDRIAAKINSSPATSSGACGSKPNSATVVSANRLQYRVQYQHSTAPSSSYSCNISDENECKSTPGCTWDTTSANVCVGWNYTVKAGSCNGSYSQPACVWNGTSMDPGYGSSGYSGGGYSSGYSGGYSGGSSGGSNEQCQYGYDTQAECSSSEAQQKGCYWGTVSQQCYAGSQTECNARPGCSWQAYPDIHRSCTSNTYESGCKSPEAAAACSWIPR